MEKVNGATFFPPQYIRYLEEIAAGLSEIREVYQRACNIHLRDKFRPHLSWAAFEEENGEFYFSFVNFVFDLDTW